MNHSSTRSQFMKAGAVAAAAAPLLSRISPAAASSDPAKEIGAILSALPGTSGAFIQTSDGKFSYAHNADHPFVVASCFKVFVAVAAHRMVEDGHATLNQLLPLNESVYVPGSSAFVPQLHGAAPLHVALQEMIAYSDNTATDMVMHLVGVAKIRELIASAGLKSVIIPQSVRALYSYLGGMAEGKLATYGQLHGTQALPAGLTPRSAANNRVTSKASARDLATFYRRALHGEFFKKDQTLKDFRVTMSTGAGLAELAIPHGSAAYMKAGSIEGDLSAVAVAGAMQTLDKTAYFMIAANWTDTSAGAYARNEPAVLAACKSILTIVRAQQ